MKHWNDQPNELENSQLICDFYLNNRHVALHVYKLENTFYVTIGNLFGSQTIKCPSVESVLTIIGIASKSKDGDNPKDLPPGFVLMPNCKELNEV